MNPLMNGSKSRLARVFLFLLLLWNIRAEASPCIAPEYCEFYLAPVNIIEGGSGFQDIFAQTSFNLIGFSLSVKILDTSLVSNAHIVIDDTDTGDLVPDYFYENGHDEWMVSGVVFSFLGNPYQALPPVLPGDPMWKIARIQFDLNPSVPPGSYPIFELEDGGSAFAGSPSITNIVVHAGASRSPELINEEVTVLSNTNPFIRGDTNGDSSVNIVDPIYLLRYLFVAGSPPPYCEDAADANDDGTNNIVDAIVTLSALFVAGSPPIPLPHPDPGSDPTPDALNDCP